MNPFIAFLTNYIDLTVDEKASLENVLESVSFKEGDILLNEKSICKYIIYLVSGKAG